MATRQTATTAVLETGTQHTRGKGKGQAAAVPAPVEEDLNLDAEDFEAEEDEDILAEEDDLLDDDEENDPDSIKPEDALPDPAPKVDPTTLPTEQRAQNVAARIAANIHSKTGFFLSPDCMKTIEKGFIFGVAGLVTSAALAQGMPKDKLGEVRAAVLEMMGNPGSNQKPATARDKETVQRTMENLGVWIAYARLYYPLSSDDETALVQILELNARDLQRASSSMSRNSGNNSMSSSDELY